MPLLSTTIDLPSFTKVFTKLFDEINLVNMLYDYYYQQWSITVRNAKLLSFDITLNSDVLTTRDFHYVKRV